MLSGLHFLAFGPFDPAQLEVCWADTPRPTTERIEAVIEQTWQEQLARARESGAVLYNGRMARYLSHEQRAGRLVILAGPTTYREFVGTNLFQGHRRGQWGWERFANPIGTSAVVVTSDGWLLLGRRGPRVVFHAGFLHTFGGTLEEADLAGGAAIDPFAAVARELQEELGITQGELKRLVCTGFLHDSQIWQPELLFDAVLTVPRQALEARFAGRGERAEHAGVEGCPDQPAGLLEWLDAARPVTDVAVGGVLLHGRRVWGAEWFARQLER